MIVFWSYFLLIQKMTPFHVGGCDEGPVGVQAPVSRFRKLVPVDMGAVAKVRLECKPQSAGVLTLRGIEWALSGTAIGRRIFTPRPPLRRGGGAARCAPHKLPRHKHLALHTSSARQVGSRHATSAAAGGSSFSLSACSRIICVVD